MKRKKPKKSKTIGRSDKASFPEFDLAGLSVKVDSGAYTSAIHCCKIEENSEGLIDVIFLDEKDPNYTGETHTFKELEKKKIRSSNGDPEERFVVTTQIKLDKKTYPIEMSLTFRGDMKYPVLIGRRFLSKNRFVVNPRLKNHIHKKSKKK